MKKSISSTVLAFSLALTLSSVSAVNCCAYQYYDYGNSEEYITVQKKPKTAFVILSYKNNDGELTVTGCYDYGKEFVVNPLTNGKKYGYIALFVLDGVLEIPSHIDDKPVVGIKSLSGNETIKKVIVPEAVTEIRKSALCGKSYEFEAAEDELRVKTYYC